MIKEIVEDLLSVDDRTWALYAYKKEPLRGRITFTEYFENYVPGALADAKRLAEDCRGKSLDDLVKELSLKVEMLPMQQGQVVYDFAIFNEPDTVQIYEDNARESQVIVDSLDDERAKVDICDMLLAHEIFHALQGKYDDLFVNRKHIKLWKLFGYENVSRLVSLEELAAMYFAKYYLGMGAVPYVYDVVMSMSRDPKKAKELYAGIMKLREEVNG